VGKVLVQPPYLFNGDGEAEELPKSTGSLTNLFNWDFEVPYRHRMLFPRNATDSTLSVCQIPYELSGHQMVGLTVSTTYSHYQLESRLNFPSCSLQQKQPTFL
jgi:hypothetical protein